MLLVVVALLLRDSNPAATSAIGASAVAAVAAAIAAAALAAALAGAVSGAKKCY